MTLTSRSENGGPAIFQAAIFLWSAGDAVIAASFRIFRLRAESI
jgi:hypothetical protein